MTTKRSTSAPILAILLAAAIVSSCDTSLDPFVESDLTYTILGYLDTDEDTQRVRIVPLRQVVDRGGPDPIDAVVTTTDLGSGETATWQDRITELADGTYGHIYWSAFRAKPGHTYQIEVRRSDGATTTAQTTVPPYPSHPDSVYGALNETGGYAPLFWPGVTRVIDVDVTYQVAAPLSCVDVIFPPPEETKFVFVRYTDDDQGSQWDSNTWRIDLNLYDDREIVNDTLGLFSLDRCVALYSLNVRLATPSEDWEPPGGIWDPDVLIQPGIFSNVDGGLGWFGSVARTTVDWQLSLIALQDLFYLQYEGRPSPPP